MLDRQPAVAALLRGQTVAQARALLSRKPLAFIPASCWREMVSERFHANYLVLSASPPRPDAPLTGQSWRSLSGDLAWRAFLAGFEPAAVAQLALSSGGLSSDWVQGRIDAYLQPPL